MKGYIQNKGTRAYFVCQRQIPPGGKVTLEAVYQSVGKKSGLEDNLDFVEWLKSNVFKRGSWEYYEEEGKLLFGKLETTSLMSKSLPIETPVQHKTSPRKESDAKGSGRALRRNTKESKGAKITPATIVQAPYEQARTFIEKCSDKSILRKALNATKHYSGKEEHMRHLVKRLEQVY